MTIESNLFQANIHQSHFRISQAYKDRYRTLALNIKGDKNTEIRIKILLNVISAKQLCTMDETDLMNSEDKLALKK